MISQITEKIGIGDWNDLLDSYGDLSSVAPCGVLSVSRDIEELIGHVPFTRLENNISARMITHFVHFSLIDGKGNHPSMLEAARLSLSAMVDECDRVLVCCWEGKSRSVAVVCYYLMIRNGLDLDTAYQYVKKQRECANMLPVLGGLIETARGMYHSCSSKIK